MKYKVLLCGSNKKLINDFFFQMDFSFECMSASLIFDDLKNHLQYFKPDIFVFCMNTESRDDVMTIASFHNEIAKHEIPFVAIGDSASREFITKIPGAAPDLDLSNAISTVDIEEQLISFIQKHKTRAAYSEMNIQTDTSSVISPSANDLQTSTFDIMEEIDAQIQMMEKTGVSLNEQPFNPGARQPEIPGRHRILVIDDATIVHKAIKGYLDSEYEVATAISGKIAMRYLQSKEVSLILLDYEMPEMDGPAVLTKLRENPYLAQIPVVFLTGINDVDKIKNALALKPQGYLLKPVDQKALIDKIHELVV